MAPFYLPPVVLISVGLSIAGVAQRRRRRGFAAVALGINACTVLAGLLMYVYHVIPRQ
jgi:hypothetical protein